MPDIMMPHLWPRILGRLALDAAKVVRSIKVISRFLLEIKDFLTITEMTSFFILSGLSGKLQSPGQRARECEPNQGIIVPLDLPEFEILSQCMRTDESI